jgi:hypothetical protein
LSNPQDSPQKKTLTTEGTEHTEKNKTKAGVSSVSSVVKKSFKDPHLLTPIDSG